MIRQVWLREAIVRQSFAMVFDDVLDIVKCRKSYATKEPERKAVTSVGAQIYWRGA